MVMVKNILRYGACTVLLLAALAMLSFATNYFSRREFATPPAQLEARAAPSINGTNINIALIGDSWVSHQILDGLLTAEMASHGWKVDIQSFGHPGGGSRTIYEDLFKPDNDAHSSQKVLYGKPVHIGVIVAGLNDSFTCMGPDFYAHHVTMIMDSFKKRGIYPLVLELPEYGIEELDYARHDPLLYLRNALTRWLMRYTHHAGKAHTIPVYRSALEAMLHTRFGSDDYSIIDFDAITTDYRQDRSLYKSDMIHLSENGRRLLARQIATTIKDWLSRRTS